MKIEMGDCIYCGQVRQFEVEDGISLSQEEKNRKATEQCDCDDAKNAHAQERVLTTTQKNIIALFHEDRPEMEKLLLEATDYIYNGTRDKITRPSGPTKGQVSINSKGSIKVERERKTKTALEA